MRNVSLLLKVQSWELRRNCLARKHINLLDNLIEAKGNVKEIRTVNSDFIKEKEEILKKKRARTMKWKVVFCSSF